MPVLDSLTGTREACTKMNYEKKTRLPSNLRPTTCGECVHLVTRRYFQSRDEDGGHNLRSIIAENPMLHVNVMALFYGHSKFYIAGIGTILPFCCRDLDLDPVIFIYEFDPYFLRYTGCANMNLLRQGFLKLSSGRQTDRQTRPKLCTTPLAGGQ